jgi:hypothetical protein
MRPGILMLAFLLLSNASSPAWAWSLITEEEFRRDQAAPHIEESFAHPPAGAPSIEVEQPDETKPIKSPVTIKIHFHAQDGAVIVPSSISITYGCWLPIPITDRVLEHAKLNKDELSAKNAELPPGHYCVTLTIADNKGRVARQTFEFTVT